MLVLPALQCRWPVWGNSNVDICSYWLWLELNVLRWKAVHDVFAEVIIKVASASKQVAVFKFCEQSWEKGAHRPYIGCLWFLEFILVFFYLFLKVYMDLSDRTSPTWSSDQLMNCSWKYWRSKLKLRGDRGFSIGTPKLWNNLLLYIKGGPLLYTFKTCFKHIFVFDF